MPPAIVAVAAAAAGAAVSGGVAGAIGTGLFATIIGAVAGGVVTIGISYLGNALLGSDAERRPETDLDQRGQMVRQPITSHRWVFGEVRVSGPVVYLHTRPRDGSSKYDMLHLVVVLAAHEVAAIEEPVWFGTELVDTDAEGAATDATWAKDGEVYVHLYRHLGAADQVADPVLVAEAEGWTEAHRLRSRAYLHARLRWDQKMFQGGVPNIAARVRGRTDIWDPRDDTTGWTRNAALCVLFYLMHPDGLGAAAAEIDTASFIAAANICDEPVEDGIGGSEPRYTIDGVVDLATPPVETLRALLTACAGHLTYTGGLWRLRVGAWYPATVAVTEAHLRDAVTVVPHRSRRELVNTVRGAFVSPSHDWQTTDYPPQTDPALVASDGGEAVLTLDLPFTTSPTMAQRIARIALEQNRQEMQLTLPCTLAGLRLAAGDTASVDLSRLGINGTFMVANWALASDLGVDLTLWADAPAVYNPPNLVPLAVPPPVSGGDNRNTAPDAPSAVAVTSQPYGVLVTWSETPDQGVVEVWTTPYDPAVPPAHDPSDPSAGPPVLTDAGTALATNGNVLVLTSLPNPIAVTKVDVVSGSTLIADPDGTGVWVWTRAIDRFGNASAFTEPLLGQKTNPAQDGK